MTIALLPPLPPLPTLDEKPSWANRAGRLDRAACAELRASDVWREAGLRSTRSGSKRLAVGEFTIDAEWLHHLHATRSPFELSGDRRSQKSNAMKYRRTRHQPRYRLEPSNPNKGAAREKKLGLWAGDEFAHQDRPWRQTIRVERWQRGKAVRSSTTAATGSPTPARTGDGGPPAYQHFLICPRCEKKVVKLFLPQCTAREATDAEFAESWIVNADRRLRASRAPTPREYLERRARLIDRYGLLFSDRQMLCRQCLGLRYGEVRRTARHALHNRELDCHLAALERRGFELPNRPRR